MIPDYSWMKLKWGYEVKRFEKDPRYRWQVYIPKLVRWRSPQYNSQDIIMPKSAAQALMEELQRILAEPGLEGVVLEKRARETEPDERVD